MGIRAFLAPIQKIPTYDQDARLATAAAFLFAATGDLTYKSHFEAYYLSFHSMDWWYWYPFEQVYQDVLLYYASLPGASTSVSSTIHTRCTSSMTSNNPDFFDQL